MFALTLCLLSQLQPLKIEYPKLDDYLKLCAQAKANTVKQVRAELKKTIDDKSRGKGIIEAKAKAKKDLAELDRIEKDPTVIVHPALALTGLQPGQIGMIDEDPGVIGDTNKVHVVSILDDETLLCQFGEQFILHGVETENIITGKEYEFPYIFIVSARYKFDGETVYALEPWAHSGEYNLHVRELIKQKNAKTNTSPKKSDEPPAAVPEVPLRKPPKKPK